MMLAMIDRFKIAKCIYISYSNQTESTLSLFKQNSKGSFFELSAKTHQQYYGTNSLHLSLPNRPPINPVDRDRLC
ncbi:hypothetical protein THF5G08_120160 [Vibrio jasicida]|nr:hypothetical protein THF5G08_120160 [Vibrio jasicida]